MSIVDTNTSGTLPLWIGGKAVAAGAARTADITNPATGAVIRELPLSPERVWHALQARGSRDPA